MSLHGIPSNYLDAGRLGVDANAMLAIARAMYLALTPTQQAALVDASKVHGGYRIEVRSVATSRAMFDMGLLTRTHKWARLTGLGMMLREAGVYSREQVDA